jgi:hypothetical protein
MNDPLNDALREATLAVLLGSTAIPHGYVDQFGNQMVGTVTIESAFVQRIRSKAFEGEFDSIIREAMSKIDADEVASRFEQLFAEQILAKLKESGIGYGSGRREPNWIQDQTRSIAVEACTQAVQADEALMDELRMRIGSQVDRNNVGITVQLSDREKG